MYILLKLLHLHINNTLYYHIQASIQYHYNILISSLYSIEIFLNLSKTIKIVEIEMNEDIEKYLFIYLLRK